MSIFQGNKIIAAFVNEYFSGVNKIQCTHFFFFSSDKALVSLNDNLISN